MHENEESQKINFPYDLVNIVIQKWKTFLEGGDDQDRALAESLGELEDVLKEHTNNLNCEKVNDAVNRFYEKDKIIAGIIREHLNFIIEDEMEIRWLLSRAEKESNFLLLDKVSEWGERFKNGLEKYYEKLNKTLVDGSDGHPVIKEINNDVKALVDSYFSQRIENLRKIQPRPGYPYPPIDIDGNPRQSEIKKENAEELSKEVGENLKKYFSFSTNLGEGKTLSSLALVEGENNKQVPITVSKKIVNEMVDALVDAQQEDKKIKIQLGILPSNLQRYFFFRAIERGVEPKGLITTRYEKYIKEYNQKHPKNKSYTKKKSKEVVQKSVSRAAKSNGIAVEISMKVSVPPDFLRSVTESHFVRKSLDEQSAILVHLDAMQKMKVLEFEGLTNAGKIQVIKSMNNKEMTDTLNAYDFNLLRPEAHSQLIQNRLRIARLFFMLPVERQKEIIRNLRRDVQLEIYRYANKEQRKNLPRSPKNLHRSRLSEVTHEVLQLLKSKKKYPDQLSMMPESIRKDSKSQLAFMEAIKKFTDRKTKTEDRKIKIEDLLKASDQEAPGESIKKRQVVAGLLCALSSKPKALRSLISVLSEEQLKEILPHVGTKLIVQLAKIDEVSHRLNDIKDALADDQLAYLMMRKWKNGEVVNFNNLMQQDEFNRCLNVSGFLRNLARESGKSYKLSRLIKIRVLSGSNLFDFKNKESCKMLLEALKSDVVVFDAKLEIITALLRKAKQSLVNMRAVGSILRDYVESLLEKENGNEVLVKLIEQLPNDVHPRNPTPTYSRDVYLLGVLTPTKDKNANEALRKAVYEEGSIKREEVFGLMSDHELRDRLKKIYPVLPSESPEEVEVVDAAARAEDADLGEGNVVHRFQAHEIVNNNSAGIVREDLISSVEHLMGEGQAGPSGGINFGGDDVPELDSASQDEITVPAARNRSSSYSSVSSMDSDDANTGEAVLGNDQGGSRSEPGATQDFPRSSTEPPMNGVPTPAGRSRSSSYSSVSSGGSDDANPDKAVLGNDQGGLTSDLPNASNLERPSVLQGENTSTRHSLSESVGVSEDLSDYFLILRNYYENLVNESEEKIKMIEEQGGRLIKIQSLNALLEPLKELIDNPPKISSRQELSLTVDALIVRIEQGVEALFAEPLHKQIHRAAESISRSIKERRSSSAHSGGVADQLSDSSMLSDQNVRGSLDHNPHPASSVDGELASVERGSWGSSTENVSIFLQAIKDLRKRVKDAHIEDNLRLNLLKELRELRELTSALKEFPQSSSNNSRVDDCFDLLEQTLENISEKMLEGRRSEDNDEVSYESEFPSLAEPVRTMTTVNPEWGVPDSGVACESKPSQGPSPRP